MPKIDKLLHDALHNISLSLDLDLVEQLLDEGAEINAKDVDGNTPLLIVARDVCGTMSLLKLLLDRGADINAKDLDGRTALHLAADADTKERECVELLVNRGANINAKDNDRCTPLHLACEKAFLGKMELLVEKGAEINAKDVDGDTPLHAMACNRNGKDNTDIVELFLEYKADPTARNEDGYYPSEVAKENGYDKIRKFLKEYEDEKQPRLRKSEYIDVIERKDNEIALLKNEIAKKDNEIASLKEKLKKSDKRKRIGENKYIHKLKEKDDEKAKKDNEIASLKEKPKNPEERKRKKSNTSFFPERHTSSKESSTTKNDDSTSKKKVFKPR